jgi:hypothetical protein
MAQGVPATPYGVVQPPLYFFIFFIDLKGVAEGWLGHPHGLRGGQPPLYFFFFIDLTSHPHGPRGASHPLWAGSATPLIFFFFIDLRGWLMGVAQPPPDRPIRPPPWPKGRPATPYGVVRPPLFFFFFFFHFNIFYF